MFKSIDPTALFMVSRLLFSCLFCKFNINHLKGVMLSKAIWLREIFSTAKENLYY